MVSQHEKKIEKGRKPVPIFEEWQVMLKLEEPGKQDIQVIADPINKADLKISAKKNK